MFFTATLPPDVIPDHTCTICGAYVFDEPDVVQGLEIGGNYFCIGCLGRTKKEKIKSKYKSKHKLKGDFHVRRKCH